MNKNLLEFALGRLRPHDLQKAIPLLLILHAQLLGILTEKLPKQYSLLLPEPFLLQLPDALGLAGPVAAGLTAADPVAAGTLAAGLIAAGLVAAGTLAAIRRAAVPIARLVPPPLKTPGNKITVYIVNITVTVDIIETTVINPPPDPPLNPTLAGPLPIEATGKGPTLVL